MRQVGSFINSPSYGPCLSYFDKLITLFPSSSMDTDSTAMDSLEALLGNCGVNPTIANELSQAGWNTESFHAVVSNAAELDGLWGDLFPDRSDLPILEKARIKVAWNRLNKEASSSQPVTPSAPVVPADTSWNELHPPKLSASVLSELKQQYLQNYPSEILTSDTCPSARLIAMVHAQVQKSDFHWIPWKFRMSQQRMEDLQMARPHKIAKTENSSLHQLLLEDPPQIEVSNQNMGLNGIRTMFDLVNTAYALVQGAHLGRLRAYSVKFVGLISSRLEADTGLRHVTPLEAQAADRHLWNIIHDLTSDRNWSLNDSLHEVTTMRSEMMGLLQPRPRPALRSFASDSSPAIAKGKGRGKGKTKTKHSQQGPRWVSEINIQGKRHSICMRYQTGACSNSQCRFKHVCAVPKPDGTACGGNHSAREHSETPH